MHFAFWTKLLFFCLFCSSIQIVNCQSVFCDYDYIFALIIKSITILFNSSFWVKPVQSITVVHLVQKSNVGCLQAGYCRRGHGRRARRHARGAAQTVADIALVEQLQQFFGCWSTGYCLSCKSNDRKLIDEMARRQGDPMRAYEPV